MMSILKISWKVSWKWNTIFFLEVHSYQHDDKPQHMALFSWGWNLAQQGSSSAAPEYLAKLCGWSLGSKTRKLWRILNTAKLEQGKKKIQRMLKGKSRNLIIQNYWWASVREEPFFYFWQCLSSLTYVTLMYLTSNTFNILRGFEKGENMNHYKTNLQPKSLKTLKCKSLQHLVFSGINSEILFHMHQPL